MLIDLNKYLPFDIDEEMFKKLSFSETLFISYIPSKVTIIEMTKTKPKETVIVVPEQKPCGCESCHCVSNAEQSKKFADGNTQVSFPGNVSTYNKSDSTLYSDDESSFSESGQSIEFNDSFFQPNYEDSVMYTISNDSIYECLNTKPVVLKDCLPAGAKSIKVERVGVNNEKFSIYLSSRYYQDGYEVGLTLSSTVDKRLHTLDESCMEHMKKSESEFYLRECSLILQPENYRCEFSLRTGEESSIRRLTLEHSDEMLGEGAFILLFRYMAITRFQGECNLKQINIYGDICDIKIVSKIDKCMCVNNVFIPVMTICKSKVSPSGQAKIKGFILTLSGQLIQAHSSNSKYVIHINPNQKVNKLKQSIEVMSPFRNSWKDNIHKFFSFISADLGKTVEEDEVEEQRQKVHLQAMLTEFYDVILMMRPMDVIPFTSSYFFNLFSADDIPHNPYFDKIFRRVRYTEDF